MRSMVTHSTYVASTILKNIHSSSRSYLIWSCMLNLIWMPVAMCTARNSLVLCSQISNFRKKTLLSTKWKLFMVQCNTLILKFDLVDSVNLILIFKRHNWACFLATWNRPLSIQTSIIIIQNISISRWRSTHFLLI